MNSSDISLSIGILGGGQLGKMLAQAGADWNLDLSVLEPAEDAPASCCARQIIGNFRAYDDVMNFGSDKDLITVEIEDVNLDALKKLQSLGKKVYPDPDSLALIQDKGLQKLFYRENNFSTAEFILVDHKDEIIYLLAENKIKYPFVQKLRKAGYDGRGVQLILSEADLEKLFSEPSVVENKIDIKKELAVIAARNPAGQVVTYDPVEMVFHPTANLLLYQECPSSLSTLQVEIAKKLAAQLISKMNIVGLLAVEMFLDQGDNFVINEVAPRPHNSGHHTIEASITSQYHQHWRSVLNLPLGDTDIHLHSVLLNILGESGYVGKAIFKGLNECLQIPGIYIHLYGKKETRPFRKMGHVTITGNDMNEIRSKAEKVTRTLKVIA